MLSFEWAVIVLYIDLGVRIECCMKSMPCVQQQQNVLGYLD